MIEIQSILVATDFSLDSRHAVERAAILGSALAMNRGALLHVMEQSWIDSLKQFLRVPTEVEHEVLEAASRSLNDLAQGIRRSSGFSFEQRLTVGNTLDVIGKVASEFDLLVLGARGRHPVRALALGTTSQRILNKTRRPVLVVKRKPKAPYERVLVGVDFSPYSLKALQYSQVVAPEAVIFLAHLFEPLFEMKMVSAGVSNEIIEEYRVKAHLEAEASLTGFIKESGVDPRNLVRIVEHGHAPGKLPEIARKWAPELIIVGKHGRSRIEELLLGSVTLHILAESRCDVLVVE